MTYTAEETRLLKQFVSNIDRPVYAIYNLPEEVIAVIFAYVSRSPKSFRRNLLSLVQNDDLDMKTADPAALLQYSRVDYASEKARKFHEKWVVGYGHSSVSEHAVVHLGVENLSRFASSLLELANPFLSFTEYSQRYQKPEPGAYHKPAVLEKHEGLYQAYCDFQDWSYRAYTQAQQILLEHLTRDVRPAEGETDQGFLRRMEKWSFEDARYLLSLAVHSNLGMTGNGRALRDAVVRLFAHPYQEVAELARSIRDEASTLLPALLRHADPNAYQEQLGRLQSEATGQALPLSSHPRESANPIVSFSEARLLQCQEQESALATLLAVCLYEHAAQNWEQTLRQIEAMSRSGQEDLFSRWVNDLGPFDPFPEGFRFLRYRFELTLSEANWHQLLRHCRGIDFSCQKPGVDLGYTIPPRAREAGLQSLFHEAAEASADLYHRLAGSVPEAAPYTVLNLHRRRVFADFHLGELCHLVRLRGKADAQWDIRHTVAQMWDAACSVHPFLRRLPLAIDGDGLPQ